ncbi:MAG: exodeoxyribonuclease V subunit beta [Desulfobulbus sp.]|jgi:exodeoxyribonuclease V beta subunit|uniref:exodeoxyribonuclease V subunit beta n=1 Tax=Desulfobulbus sp. TaxID=895 RepID=UPI002844294D|nr:exodeoxyribonuclease V subunit beta [Desulfobulbus sp.]MDR2551182.1 exodeoxyribonuclease V subunit beta [Desulfobulbus sp.]
MRPLDPLTLPLNGWRLLEASAGTGKTYTLTLLFLRLLLERELAIDQILVVTFTRAATGELRDRIRQRLRQALDHLDNRADAVDPQLGALLAAVPPDPARQRLADALVRLDEAAIHTIHSFCQRILQEHAFESAMPFEAELLTGEADLRLQVIEDFWRNRFYPASDREATWAATTWTDPAGLLRALGKAAAGLDCDLIPAIDPQELAALHEADDRLFAEVRGHWLRERQQVGSILTVDPGLKRNEQAYRQADRVPQLIAAMDRLAECHEPPLLLPDRIDRLAASVMARHIKTKCEPPDHPFFMVFDRWFQLHTRLGHLRVLEVLHRARQFLDVELDRRKRAQGWLSYDDLLSRLAEALERRDSGPGLAARLVARYPVALIDEFQDTDPVQYRIFSRIYRHDGTLLLIGDPKQAIYSFRGADIFTYILARRATEPDNRLTLGVNHRATPAMVQAVNTLFGRSEDAFIFKDDIVFQPVRAAEPSRAQPLALMAREVPPLLGLLLDTERLQRGKSKTVAKEQALRASTDFCAEALVQLLEAAHQRQATIAGQPLAPGDIAILARTNREAEAMRKGLQRRGLNCAFLSQDSVFAAPEAQTLALVLGALLAPADLAGIRTALATDLFGCDAEALYRLAGDERGWEERLAGLLRYRQIWTEQGFLPMFQHLLATERVTWRLTAQSGGRRSLTNYLHLAELLQASPAGRHGAGALLRWLHRQIAHPDPDADNQLLRLEDDEHLIRILTIHRAKGLEFPVVILPFLWSGRTPATDGPLVFHRRDSLRLVLDLGTGQQEHRRWAEEEALAEEMRLLYVAMTRAKSCCLFCWGRVSGMERTALAHLLHQGRCPEDDIGLRRELESLNKERLLCELRPYPETFGSHRLAAADKVPRLRPAVFPGRISPGWSLTSYSRLSAGADQPEAADRDEWDHPAAARPEDFGSIFTFPRGPKAGTCLHALLERIDSGRPAGEQSPLIVRELEQAGIDPRWLPALAGWLDEVLVTPLPGTCALGQLAACDRINELSFLFPLEEVDPVRLNRLLAQAGLRPLAGGSPVLHGLMKGFIDLVFRHEGRYYLADYKSNFLGPELAHYAPAALDACMDSHQYPLQALIYTLALHRFLGTRMPDYRYDDHFGGVYYLFLRAMHPSHPLGTGIHAFRPDRALIASLDDCCRGGGDR